MKITVVGGAGAMGGVWASKLSAGGHDVAILDVAKSAIDAIRRDGLTVIHRDESVDTYSILATDDASEIGLCDAIIVFVKAHHTAAAAHVAKPLTGPETTVASLQNGWGNVDTLAGFYPREQLVMGVSYHSATVRAPGVIAHTADHGPTFIGPYLDGAPLDRARALGDAMTGSGISTTVSADAKTEVWRKLILNSATLPIAGLTRRYTGGFGNDAALLAVCDVLAREACAVAQAKGMAIETDERIAYVRDLVAKGAKGKASMLQDVEAQRKTEIEVICGAIVREGDALGIDVPFNRAMVALVNGLEASWTQ